MISVHFVVVTKSIVETAMDDLFPCEPTLQLFLETFRLLNEQDTTMTLEFVLQLCDDCVATWTSSASQGIAFTPTRNDEKLLGVNINVIDKQVHKMLLATDITTNDCIEDEFDFFNYDE